MNTRAERIRHVIQHRDGEFLNIRCEHKKNFMDAYRWGSVEEIQGFLSGHYAPLNPSEYQARMVRITYELMEEET